MVDIGCWSWQRKTGSFVKCSKSKGTQTRAMYCYKSSAQCARSQMNRCVTPNVEFDGWKVAAQLWSSKISVADRYNRWLSSACDFTLMAELAILSLQFGVHYHYRYTTNELIIVSRWSAQATLRSPNFAAIATSWKSRGTHHIFSQKSLVM